MCDRSSFSGSSTSSPDDITRRSDVSCLLRFRFEKVVREEKYPDMVTDGGAAPVAQVLLFRQDVIVKVEIEKRAEIWLPCAFVLCGSEEEDTGDVEVGSVCGGGGSLSNLHFGICAVSYQ